MMLRSGLDGTVLVVEGITDRRLYGKFMDKEHTDVVIAHSKDNVRNSVREVYSQRGMRSVVGIMDADLDNIWGKKRSPPLFLTDTRDSENMMLMSDAFGSVMEEYGDPEKVDAYESRYGDVRENVIRACYPLGALMAVSIKNGLGLSFKDLDFEEFIDRRSLACDVRRMAQTVIDNSGGARRVSPKDLVQMISDEKESEPEDVCRGHDLMSVLAVGLRNIFGGSNCRNITGNQLGGAFRLAYGKADFESTDLFKESNAWCRAEGIPLWDIRA